MRSNIELIINIITNNIFYVEKSLFESMYIIYIMYKIISKFSLKLSKPSLAIIIL